MPHGLRIRVTILAAIVPIGCSDAGPTAVVEKPAPHGIEVRATLAFGDPPLVGELRIKPADDGPDWQYSVDIDGDGRADERGPVRLGVSVGYRFEQPGVHRISVNLERSGSQERIQRFVVVNDPSATRVLAEALLDEPGGFAGIQVDSVGGRLFAVASEHRLLSLRPSDLRTIWTLPLPGVRFEHGYLSTEGMALSGGKLYVDTGDSLVAVRIDGEPAVLDAVAPARWGAHLHARRDGLIYVGGYAGLALVDPLTGNVLAARESEEGCLYAVSPDEDVVASLQGFTEPVLVLLDGDDLTERKTIAWPQELPRPVAISFNHRGDRLYVFFEADVRLIVIDLDSGTILRDMVLARSSRLSYTTTNSAVLRGRFVVVPTTEGAFFIDTRDDLPHFRIRVDSQSRDSDILCCSVAASHEPGVFYFAEGVGGALTKIRLSR